MKEQWEDEEYRKQRMGHLVSETTRQKISNAHTGRKHTAQARQHMSEAKRLPSIFGEKNHAAKLTFAQVQEARELRLNGWTFAALAKRYGVAYATIRQAVVEITWKGLQEDGTDSTA